MTQMCILYIRLANGRKVMTLSRNPTDTELMLAGYGLTTAEFFYRMPDYQHVIHSYVWEFLDLAPDFPALFDKIEFWEKQIDGPLHSIVFSHSKMLGLKEWRRQT